MYTKQTFRKNFRYYYYYTYTLATLIMRNQTCHKNNVPKCQARWNTERPRGCYTVCPVSYCLSSFLGGGCIFEHDYRERRAMPTTAGGNLNFWAYWEPYDVTCIIKLHVVSKLPVIISWNFVLYRWPSFWSKVPRRGSSCVTVHIELLVQI